MFQHIRYGSTNTAFKSLRTLNVRYFFFDEYKNKYETLASFLKGTNPQNILVDLCPLQVERFRHWLSENPEPKEGFKKKKKKKKLKIIGNYNEQKEIKEKGKAMEIINKSKAGTFMDDTSAESKSEAKYEDTFRNKLMRMDKLAQGTADLTLMAPEWTTYDEWLLSLMWDSFAFVFARKFKNFDDFVTEFYLSMPRWRFLSLMFGPEFIDILRHVDADVFLQSRAADATTVIANTNPNWTTFDFVDVDH
ncbi:hypothetical protein RFI_12378, partial [Reticulomyxa filosa]